MSSLILRTATRFLVTVLLLFSIFLTIRGHNEPGGGFVGGLVAAAAFVLYAIAYNVDAARRSLVVEPHTFIGVGLMIALLSSIIPFFTGLPLLTGLWWPIKTRAGFELELGSTLFFDIGVYLTVLGVTLMIMFALVEE